MRQSLLITLLGVVLVAATITPLTKSDAAKASQQQDDLNVNPPSQTTTLPNYDVRLTGQGEFADFDLNHAAPVTRSAVQRAAVQSRAAAVNQFRASLQPEAARNLRAVVNDVGAMKNLFVDGGTLSGPQPGPPDITARSFLQRHASLFALPRAEVPNLKLDNEDNDAGTTFLDYFQTVGGIKVFEGHVQVVVNKSGEILSVREGFIISGQPVQNKPSLTEEQGIAKAFEHAGRTVLPAFAETQPRASQSDMSRFANPIAPDLEEVLSELNVVRVGQQARLAWHVYTDVGPNEWYETLVDAQTGELLYRRNLYVSEAQGTVYTESPGAGERQLISFVGDTTINTAAGWMGTATVTTGNNAEAYLDVDANNAPDATNGNGLANGHASALDQNFTFPFSTAADPRQQQAAVVANLFYYNNFMHDFAYRLGFTESSRNFQVNNFGRGGLGNDSVRAEAQDGSGTNNANFGTPPDGQRPRMQQFLFTGPNPDRDSSLDSDVVFHEYGHGISNRLIGNGGGLGGTQSGAMGEGWSDYWASTINNDGVMGDYVTNNPTRGIRRAAYSVPANPVHDSYADVGVGGFQVHRDGEVWSVTLWDLRAQLGAATADRLVLQGMKFTPSRPSFLNARDGILQADQNLNGGANRCAIWAVFARHGMGVSAVGNDGTTHTAATDVPADCNGGGDPCANASINPTSANHPAGGGTGFSVSVTASATCNWTARSNAAFITITAGSSGTGNGTVTYSVAANTGAARTGTLTIAGRTFTVNQAGAAAGVELMTNGGFETGLPPWTLTGQAFRSTGAFPRSGTAYGILGASNNANGSIFQQITIPTGTPRNLTFWLNVTSTASTATVTDRLFIEVRSTAGALLATLATFSNQNSGTAGAYVQRGPFNLGGFAGQTVRIQFRGVNDASQPTSFRVDDISVR